MQFLYRLLLLRFEAQAPFSFPPALAGNIFRGALGNTLPRRLFAPVRTEPGPSGFADPPRPFVLRAHHLEGRHFARGDKVDLHVHLFGPFARAIVDAFHHSPPLYGTLVLAESHPSDPIAIPLSPLSFEPQRCTIRFLTPTELKIDNGLAVQPDFPILFARALTRLRLLASLYADPLTLNIPHLTDLSQQVQLTSHSLTQESAQRFSTRTNQTHPLGGFTGHAHYEGALRELIPILQAAEIAGVGRQTVWGKGAIAVVI